jgi:hypothetical protein
MPQQVLNNRQAGTAVQHGPREVTLCIVGVQRVGKTQKLRITGLSLPRQLLDGSPHGMD